MSLCLCVHPLIDSFEINKVSFNVYEIRIETWCQKLRSFLIFSGVIFVISRKNLSRKRRLRSGNGGKLTFAGHLFTPRSDKSAGYSSFDPKNFPLKNGFRTIEGLYAEPESCI